MDHLEQVKKLTKGKGRYAWGEIATIIALSVIVIAEELRILNENAARINETIAMDYLEAIAEIKKSAE